MAPPKKKKKIPKCKKKKFLSQRGKKSDGDSEYCPSSKEDTKCKQLEFDGLEVELERRLFVCESTQLMDMVKQINSFSALDMRSVVDYSSRFTMQEGDWDPNK